MGFEAGEPQSGATRGFVFDVFPDEDQHTGLKNLVIKVVGRSGLSRSPIEVVIEIRSTFNEPRALGQEPGVSVVTCK
jgi:hypothetical protein